MATVQIGNALPVDMRDPRTFYGTVRIATSTQLEIVAGSNVGDYFGQGFTYSLNGLVGGTLTGYSSTYNGGSVFAATGLNVAAVTAYQLIQSGNASQLEAIALSGNDTIYGAGDSDVLMGYGGNNTIIGVRNGIDYVAYSGAASAYSISVNSSGFVVSRPDGGQDELINIKAIEFSDQTISLPGSAVSAAGAHTQYNIADDNGSLYIQDLVPGRDGTHILPADTQINFTDGTGVFDPTGNAEEVARLYQAALDRAPDVGGLDGWTAQLNAHTMGIDGVALGFISSPEFSSKYGALDNSDFVTQLYQNVLHRAPDSAGELDWINQLNGGMTRAAVLVGFSDSLENKLDTQGTIGDPNMDEAYRLYQAALDRTPDTAGLGDWTAQLDSGISPVQVAQGFVSSNEFAKDFAGLDTKGFVDQLYQNVLHRAPDSAGEQDWINQLNGGVSKAQVVLGFSDSLENRLDTSHATHDSWVFVHS